MDPCRSEKEYLDQIIEPARKACRRYGYLPSVLIAQACLENGYGIPSYWDNPEIVCLMKYNNMVGIKTELLNKSWVDIGLSVWPGRSITKNTPEQYGDKIVTIRDSFRIYDNPEQSFADFLCFLKYASNYGPGGTPKYGKEILDMKDPVSLIWGVSARGYATGQTYAPHVLSIIRKHDLTQYDNLSGVDPTDYVPKGWEEEKVTYTNSSLVSYTGSRRTAMLGRSAWKIWEAGCVIRQQERPQTMASDQMDASVFSCLNQKDHGAAHHLPMTSARSRSSAHLTERIRLPSVMLSICHLSISALISASGTARGS